MVYFLAGSLNLKPKVGRGDEVAAGERLYAPIEAVLGTEAATFIRESVAALSASKASDFRLIVYHH